MIRENCHQQAQHYANQAIVQLVILVHLAHLCLEPKNQHAHQAIVQLVILTLLLKVQ